MKSLSSECVCSVLWLWIDCISVKYCPDDGLYRPKHVGNIVNTSHLINIVNLFVLLHCSLTYKMHGKSLIKVKR